jgi:hypothetical protein
MTILPDVRAGHSPIIETRLDESREDELMCFTIRTLTPTLALAALLLSGCGGDAVNRAPVAPDFDVFSLDPDADAGAAARTLECTKEVDGECVQKTCAASSDNVPEVPHGCAEYAAHCVNYGHHWSGTREGGTCTRVL